MKNKNSINLVQKKSSIFFSGKILIILIMILALSACEKEALNEQTPTSGETPQPAKVPVQTETETTPQVIDESKGVEKNGCYDSDGGSFDKINGYVLDQSGETFKDVCVNQFSVREYYCGDFGFKKDKIINCNYECQNGVCVEGEAATKCVDSDYRDNFNKGTVTYNNEVKTDYCDSDRVLIEQICNNVDIAAVDTVVCDAGCSNGRCNSVVEVDQTSSCTDYDIGPDAQYTASKVKDPKGEFFDECLNIYAVKEYYCNSYGFKADKNINCANGCNAGACVR